MHIQLYTPKMKLGMSSIALFAHDSTVARRAQCNTLDPFLSWMGGWAGLPGSGLSRGSFEVTATKPALHIKVHRGRQVQHNEEVKQKP